MKTILRRFYFPGFQNLKRRIFLLLLCTSLQVLFIRQVIAQAPFVGKSIVKANFAVDGDLYANKLQFGYFHYNFWGTDSAGINHKAGTDDWFKNNSNAGAGIGIIDTVGSADFRAMINSATNNAGKNKTFYRRMAYPIGTSINGQLLLDAVGYRDYISTGASKDTTAFNPNIVSRDGNNPATWMPMPSDISHKEDLVDICAHIRMDESTGQLWSFFYTTWVYSAVECVSYEFFRSDIIYSGSSFANCGPDSGHTAYHFSLSDGSVTRPGDIIISSTVYSPYVKIYVWVNRDELAGPGTNFTAAFFNTMPSAFRPFSFTGDWVIPIGGSNTGPFVWAEITAKNPLTEPVAYRRENFTPITSGGTFKTPGAPWGSIIDLVAADSIDYPQLIETGINLSALGLDFYPSSNSSSNLLGTLLIKSFTSTTIGSGELFDYAGPFPFGHFPLEHTTISTSICQGSSYTLPNGQLVNSSGTYTTVLHTASGDSIIVTKLTVDNNCPVILNLKVFIEGYYSGNGFMNSAINLIGDPLLCDTITVELHNSVAPYSLIQDRSGTINTNGSGTFTFPHEVLGQSYYIAIRHRNSMETWSKTPVLFNALSASFDFTSP
jgi:hypothetical protein